MAARLWSWIDSRMPSLREEWRKHAAEYYAPKNFNFWYFFGSLALLVLVIQIASGIFLTMNYKPDASLAFSSVEYIMRDVPGGWIIRYIHSTGASAFFVVVFLILGFLGTEPTTVWGQFGFDAFFLDTRDRATWAARLCTVVYFLFFILMPWYTARDEVKPVPDRVTH